MLLAVYLVFLLYQTSAESAKVGYRCSNDRSVDATMTFTPSASEPKVMGRYTAELCKLKDGEWTEWQIDLNYNESNKTCKEKNSMRKPGPQHSISTLDIRSSEMPNCTRVCLSTDFDLIFKSCYQVKSTLKVDSDSGSPDDFFFNIDSNITRENVFAANRSVNFVNHDEYVSLNWILSIPPVDYNVIIQRYNNDTKDLWDLQDVTRNCSVQNARYVYCTLAPEYGCYQAKLEHGGPWTSGTFHQFKFVTFMFCHRMVAAPRVEARSSLALWLAGGALLLALALLAGLLVCRRIDYKELMDGIIKLWPPAMAPSGQAAAAHGDVLLLYAREGQAGQALAAALAGLVRAATGARVYDMYSPEVVALSAAAPSTWAREALARPGLRVLLLQTPAIELLRKPLQQHDVGAKLAAPLLGRRAVYRVPQFGDSLVANVLTIIAENPRMHNDYHKLFLATVVELETDILPTVVPFRRYRLPDMAGTLAAGLAGQAVGQAGQAVGQAGQAGGLAAHIRAVTDAAIAWQQHARDNPDYLMDELLVI